MVNCKKTKFMWKTSVFAIATLVMGPFGFAQEEAPALVDMTVRLIVDQKSGQAFWSGVTFPYEPHLLSETSLGYYVATRATNERKRLEGVVETCRKAEKCNFVIDSR